MLGLKFLQVNSDQNGYSKGDFLPILNTYIEFSDIGSDEDIMQKQRPMTIIEIIDYKGGKEKLVYEDSDVTIFDIYPSEIDTKINELLGNKYYKTAINLIKLKEYFEKNGGAKNEK